MSKKRIISNIFIYYVIFAAIFSLTRLYLVKNDFLIENVKKLNFFIFIILLITTYFLVYKYSNINKYFAMYITCILVFQMSIYSSYNKITIKDIVANIISLVICAVLIKFLDCKKLNDIIDKCNIWIIFFTYIIVMFINEYYSFSLFIILLMLKYYYMLKKDNFLDQDNFDVMLAFILFSVINIEFSMWFLIAYSYRIDLKALKGKIEDI